MRTSLLFLCLSSCGFTAGGKFVGGGDTGTDTGVPQDTGTEDTGDSTEDVDGDGYTFAEGDCDDTDPDIHPDQPDTCDGVDDDCDGEIDEDSADEDPYEPNDEEAYDLGSLVDNSSHNLPGLLHNDDDLDRFLFYQPDNLWEFWDVYTITVSLSNIPSDANYMVSVNQVDENGVSVGEVGREFGNETLLIEIGDSWGQDDSAFYEVQVEAIANADCGSNYLLTIELQ